MSWHKISLHQESGSHSYSSLSLLFSRVSLCIDVFRRRPISDALSSPSAAAADTISASSFHSVIPSSLSSQPLSDEVGMERKDNGNADNRRRSKHARTASSHLGSERVVFDIAAAHAASAASFSSKVLPIEPIPSLSFSLPPRLHPHVPFDFFPPSSFSSASSTSASSSRSTSPHSLPPHQVVNLKRTGPSLEAIHEEQRPAKKQYTQADDGDGELLLSHQQQQQQQHVIPHHQSVSPPPPSLSPPLSSSHVHGMNLLLGQMHEERVQRQREAQLLRIAQEEQAMRIQHKIIRQQLKHQQQLLNNRSIDTSMTSPGHSTNAPSSSIHSPASFSSSSLGSFVYHGSTSMNTPNAFLQPHTPVRRSLAAAATKLPTSPLARFYTQRHQQLTPSSLPVASFSLQSSASSSSSNDYRSWSSSPTPVTPTSSSSIFYNTHPPQSFSTSPWPLALTGSNTEMQTGQDQQQQSQSHQPSNPNNHDAHNGINSNSSNHNANLLQADPDQVHQLTRRTSSGQMQMD